MSSAWSQLEQMLTCAICLDKFKNPRLLPCQHSFCGDACMDGLVDYARRQIKCPECRAEHRIPYQGVQSLPLNVTLIRFLELHARITGEEPEPVPTFMEKCSICGEKVEGVQRCAHCEKKVCPECKEAHLDLLRREISRINGQSKRSLSKMHEFKETLSKAEEKLAQNYKSVRMEIEDSCKRLINDLQLKQKRLLEEVDSYVELEQKTIDKLKVAIVDECKIIESNLELADNKLITSKYQWNDFELTEAKEIYNRTMEFVRLFDPEIGDYNRKIRFILIPEFETLRKRLCDLGELKFSETAQSLIANSFQYCNATGSLAQELCQAAVVQQQQLSQHQQQNAYGLAHSNSNTNLGQSLGLGSQLSGPGSQMLELPNALMRSQSDHRLASQFQARLKQQEASAKNGAGTGASAGRYGTSRPDYETDSLRSRYAPPRSSATGGSGNKDYANDLLRDWPRPSDNDSDVSFGSSIQFKSAFMRRKEKERQQQHGAISAYGGYGGVGAMGTTGGGDDDDDLTSEASYGGGRNVRFYDQQLAEQQMQSAGIKVAAPKVFDCKEVEHAPLSGVPKLDECPQLNTRLHQLGAKAIVDKKHAEEEGKRDKDLVDSARQAMSRASERLRDRQMSEDEIEKQKKANAQQQQQQHQQEQVAANDEPAPVVASREASAPRSRPTIAQTVEQPSGSIQTQQTPGSASSGSPATPTSASSLPGGRRSLYGQAVTEKSKRQLSSAIQDAASYSARRRSMASSRDDSDLQATETESQLQQQQQQQPQDQQQPVPADSSSASGSQTSSSVRRRGLRSGGSGKGSLSKQSSSADQQSIDGSAPNTPTTRRRKALGRADSSQRQQSVESTTGVVQTSATNSQTSANPKNLSSGSGGGASSNLVHDESRNLDSATSQVTSNKQRPSPRPSAVERHTTSTTTDEDEDSGGEGPTKNTGTIRRAKLHHSQRTGSSSASIKSQRSSSKYASQQSVGADDDDDDEDDDDDDVEDDDDEDSRREEASDGERASSKRNSSNRRSREFLPTYVNKLLDRSAQIRRDSQEQRSRGDSPQRSSTTLSDSHSHRTPTYNRSSASGYSSSPGGASGSNSGTSAFRQRLAYQRSQQHTNDDDATNSNQSIYTTASSQRRSSEDEPSNSSLRRPSTGSSTDRTVISASSRRAELDDLARRDTSSTSGSRYSANRRDSTGDGGSSSGVFQSRFLARSRTSAALSSGRTQDYGQSTATTNSSPSDYHSVSSRDTDNNTTTISGQDYGSSSARSYLSSRERFMQSTGSPSSSIGSSSATGAGIGGATSSSATTGGYSRTGSGAGSSSAGIRTHSEYLRSKFARRGSSNSSGGSSSNLISRSRSSHTFATDPAGVRSIDQADVDSGESSPEASSVLSGDGSFTGAVRSAVYSPKGRMLFKLGSRGSDPGHFTWPRGVTVGQSGPSGHEIVVADSSNHRVQVFDPRGRFISEFGSYGSAPGEFDCLAGVAINRVSRNYVVSDRYNHRIQIFDMSGRFVRSFGELGRDQAKFNLPWGVACDQSGLIYVCDKENHRIQVFDSQGNYLSRFGVQGSQPGQLQHPHYIAINSSGRIVVTDTNNHRVQVFDSSGRLVKSIGREGSSSGEFKFPRGVAVDNQGFIVVGDSGNNRLQVFSPDGQFVKAIGTWGSAEGEFKGIEGVAVDSTNGNIYVCDRENHRIQVF